MTILENCKYFTDIYDIADFRYHKPSANNDMDLKDFEPCFSVSF